MTLNGWFQILLFLATIAAVTVPLGRFMARVFARERTWLDPVLGPLERLIYRLTGVDETHEMRWTEYGAATLVFSLVSMLVLYALQRLQGLLPFNPQGLSGVAPALAFNTAASFTTNTNWQSYSRRDDDELSHPDGGARLSQLRLGSRGHRPGNRVHPRHRESSSATRSGTSGST